MLKRQFLLYNIVPLILAMPAYAEDNSEAEKALNDAVKTGNQYVIDAVKKQLAADHPEMHVDASPGLMPASSSKLDVKTTSGLKPEPDAEPKKQQVTYKGEIEGGYQSNTGNTRGYSFNTKLNATRDSEDWLFLTQGTGIIDNDGTKTTNEKYRGILQANYKLEPDERLMTTLFWNNDRFTGFRNRFEEVSGLSNDWKLPWNAKLTTEIAAGARQLELTEGQEYHEPILWLRGYLQWPITEHWTFAEDLRDSTGTKYDFIWANTSMTYAFTKEWKLRFALEDEYVNNPPMGRKDLDKDTLVNLVYTF